MSWAKSVLFSPARSFCCANPISCIVQTIARTEAIPLKRLGWRPHLVLEATAYTAEGEVAYFQEIYIPSVTRKLLFDSDLRLSVRSPEYKGAPPSDRFRPLFRRKWRS